MTGCATAPTVYYENAFPSETKFALDFGFGPARGYSDGTDSLFYDPISGWPMRPIVFTAFSYSPDPDVTFSPELYTSGLSLRTKYSIFHTAQFAGAALLRLGIGGLEDYDTFTQETHGAYSTQTIESGALFSWQSKRNPLSKRPVNFVLSIGPTMIYTNLHYDSYERVYRYADRMFDYGGNLTTELGIGYKIAFSWSWSLLSVEGQEWDNRLVRPYFNIGLKVKI
jgi:hypothetical protein